MSFLLPHTSKAQADELTLKAVFLERFTRFIEWEKQSETNEFNIVIIGSDEKIAHQLKKVYRNRNIQNKTVRVTQIKHLDDLKNLSCDILFVSENMSKELEEITQYSFSKSILTIADTKNFATKGVIINFYIKNNSIQFKINTDAAKKSNLQISYHLLKMADISFRITALISIKNISIKNKITLIIVCVTFLVITIGQSILFFKEIKEHKNTIINNYISYTTLIAENCISPLTFEDKKGGHQILLSSKSIKDIHSIYLFDENKELFTFISKDEVSLEPKLKTHLSYYETKDFLIINQPIAFKGKISGYIYVKVSLQSYKAFIYDKMFFLTISTIVLLILAYFLATMLQKFISRPILELAEATKDFSLSDTYTVNLDINRKDEIGLLYNSFNILLKSLSTKEKERNAAEFALRESEEKFRVSFENAPLGIAIVDLKGDFLQINMELCNFFGYTREEMLQKSIRELIHNSDIIESKEILDSLLSGKNIGKTIETRFISKNNDTIWCILNSSLITLHKESYIIIHLIDVTKRRLAERAHIQLQGQVQQAHKMETIGTLAGGISHDFKNILNPIIGFSTLALNALEENSEAKKDIEKVIKAAHRADELVNQILAFSRQNEEETSPVVFSSVINESIELLRATIPSTAEIKVISDIESEKVLGNHTQLQQVVMNLCTNAYHALPEGQGVITIHSSKVNIDQRFIDKYHELKTGEYILLSISDNGIGMSKDVLGKNFRSLLHHKKSRPRHRIRTISGTRGSQNT